VFLTTDAVSFKIMNYTPYLSRYRHVAKEIYRNSISFVAMETVMVHNYNKLKGGQGMIIGVKNKTLSVY
jgi:hypothetical protein